MRTREIAIRLEEALDTIPFHKATIISIIHQYDQSPDQAPATLVTDAPLNADPSTDTSPQAGEIKKLPVSASTPITRKRPRTTLKTEHLVFSPDRVSPTPSTTAATVEELAVQKLQFANHLRTLIRSIAYLRYQRSADKQRDSHTLAFRKLFANRFNFSHPLHKLEQEFKKLSMDTTLIEQTRVLLERAQNTLLFQNENPTEERLLRKSLKTLIASTEIFCNAVESRYYEAAHASPEQTPEKEEVTELKEPVTSMDANLAGAHLEFCKHALQQIFFKSYDHLPDIAFNYVNRVQETVSQGEPISFTPSRVKKCLQERLSMLLRSHQQELCSQFFYDTLAFIQKNDFEGLVNYVLVLPAIIQGVEKPSVAEKKSQWDKEDKYALPDPIPTSGLQQHHLHSHPTLDLTSRGSTPPSGPAAWELNISFKK